jgi:ferredoxin-NADP reductase
MEDVKNKFFCIVKKFDDIDSNNNSFHEALSNLSVGDEIAIKKGKRLLSQGAKYCDPIRYITLVSSSLGISPSLSLLQSLRDETSAVEGLTLIWMNKEKDDFVCDDIVQSLQEQSKEKIHVYRFINNNMEDTEILFTEDLADLVMPYQKGNVVIICGSEKFINVMKSGFSEYGYTKENILLIKAE